MELGNVLVIGNSGVGKSTLINAVLGESAEKKAPASIGMSGTTKELEIYESAEIPFRIIDTVGFEPSFRKRTAAINAVRKWSKDSAKNEASGKKINVIWFCVDGTAGKLFPESIKSLSRATKMWESVPVIVVITKSYSVPERKENIQLVNSAFAAQKRYSKNLKGVIPVVASTFTLNDTAFAAPEGISELIDATNEVMPEGLKAAQKDVSTFKLARKRALAQSVVAASTVGGATVGAMPVPIADAVILSSLELAEISAIARIYDIKDDEDSKRFVNSIVEVGTVSVAAKAAIGALKAIPGVNLAASAVNAIIAAAFVVAIGEGSIYAFEKIYLGEKSVEDIDWIKKFMETKLSGDFVGKVSEVIDAASKNGVPANIAELVTEVITPLFNSKNDLGKSSGNSNQ